MDKREYAQRIYTDIHARITDAIALDLADMDEMDRAQVIITAALNIYAALCCTYDLPKGVAVDALASAYDAMLNHQLTMESNDE